MDSSSSGGRTQQRRVVRPSIIIAAAVHTGVGMASIACVVYTGGGRYCAFALARDERGCGRGRGMGRVESGCEGAQSEIVREREEGRGGRWRERASGRERVRER